MFDLDWARRVARVATIPAGSGEAVSVSLVATGGPEREVVLCWRWDGTKLDAVDDDGPDVVFTASRDDIGAIVNGDIEPAVAYMQGKLKAAGDMTWILRLLELGSLTEFEFWREAIAG